MATETTVRKTESRSHDKNVRSLAQWSRASDDTLEKSNGAYNGVLRKSAMALSG